MTVRLRRSVLATPASKDWMFDRAANCGADVVFLDLEDAVAPAVKDAARSMAIDGLRGIDWGRTERAVRINALDTPWAHDDVISIVTEARDAVDTLILPKVTAARDVWWVDVLLSQLEVKLRLGKQIRLQAVIESVDGLVNVEEIARSSSRLDALIFGTGDYSVSQGSRVGTNLEPTGHYPGDIWHYARSRILVAARVAGVEAIDAVYPDYRDGEGFVRAAEQAAVLGYAGKVAIHPDQVSLANQVFTPTDDEIARAQQSLEAYGQGERAGQGAVGLNGTLVDAVHVRLAQQVLARAKLAQGT